MKHKQSRLKFSAWNELLEVSYYIPQVSSGTIQSNKSKFKRSNGHLQERVTSIVISITFEYFEITKADSLTDQKTVWWHAHFASGSNLYFFASRSRTNFSRGESIFSSGYWIIGIHSKFIRFIHFTLESCFIFLIRFCIRWQEEKRLFQREKWKIGYWTAGIKRHILKPNKISLHWYFNFFFEIFSKTFEFWNFFFFFEGSDDLTDDPIRWFNSMIRSDPMPPLFRFLV